MRLFSHPSGEKKRAPEGWIPKNSGFSPPKKKIKEKSGSWLKSMVCFGRFPPKIWWQKNSSTSHSHPGAGREGPLFGALPERRQPLRSAPPGWIRVAKPRCGQTPVLLILVGGCVCVFPETKKNWSKWWSANLMLVLNLIGKLGVLVFFGRFWPQESGRTKTLVLNSIPPRSPS